MSQIAYRLLAFCLLLVSFASAQVAEDTARIHYFRPDGAYQGFQLHVWEDTTEEVTWEDGLELSGQDDYGVYWDVNLKEGAEKLGFIVHKGDEKDPGPDMFLLLGEQGNEIWLVSGDSNLYQEQPDVMAVPSGDLGKAQAHWLTADTIVWQLGENADDLQVSLHGSAEAALELSPEGVTGGEALELTYKPGGLGDELKQTFPHLTNYQVFKLEDSARVADLLRGQVAVSAVNAAGELVDATGLQIPGVLDDLYADAAYDEALGIVWHGNFPTLKLWAPTAQRVRLHLFSSAGSSEAEVLELVRNDASGVWSITGTPDWDAQYYLFEVTVYAPSTQHIETNLVTDPYSLSLSQNSQRSQIIDLDNPALTPEGWATLQKPPLDAPEDISIYELHVRDFSASDETVPPDLRGTYKAFTLIGTDGINHLTALVEAGLSHLHLLPTFDIASINEDKSTWQEPAGDLSSYAPNSSKQQAAVGEVRDQDAFNWGYDPYHYTVPEGSYATDPHGALRILEFREMVQSLNELGLRVVMDVVYNHTNASGQQAKSVLDKIVPGYYHRLNADGFVETSTCCQNTATEHAMMEKLMIDSLLVWARDYKIDAFRFDLMGHHMKRNMLAVKEALESLTPEEDGVDGSKIYLYGEGWDFGEVADNARGVNATQFNLAGTGIGTFNDRLRDAVRGGGPFDSGLALLSRQGFITGLGTLPNRVLRIAPAGLAEEAAHNADLIRIGLAGNLADFSFQSASGDIVQGDELDYNGSPAGYTFDPQENIVYVSKHDNQTLWDIAQYKLPATLPMRDRVRLHNLGLSIVAFAQGVPFFHAGSDMLRSKSLDRDSYDSGDWFNRLDFSYETNNWGVGLPPAWSNEDNWEIMRPLLADPTLTPEQQNILRSVEHFRELLEIRYSSPLFRLETSQAVLERLEFHNTGPDQLPGVIIMSLMDEVGEDLDPRHENIVVVFNATSETQNLTVAEFMGDDLSLHPVQRESTDLLLPFSRFRSKTGTFVVPPFTTAVFVE